MFQKQNHDLIWSFKLGISLIGIIIVQGHQDDFVRKILQFYMSLEIMNWIHEQHNFSN